MTNLQRKRLTLEELDKLVNMDIASESGIAEAQNILSAKYGEIGTQSRNDFEAKASNFASILCAKRLELNLSQKKLGERIGRDLTYVGRIEHGEVIVSLAMYIRMAKALGVDVALDILDELQ